MVNSKKINFSQEEPKVDKEDLKRREEQLTTDQQQHIQTILQALQKKNGTLFCLDAAGGTGSII